MSLTPVSDRSLESWLWDAANILRGPVDASDFKAYVFPLLFLKRISDVYDEERLSALEESGAYTSWKRRSINPRVGDAAVWLCVQYWNDIGQAARAEQVVHLAWDAGCRHPDVADAYAGQLAAAGRLADLTAGIDICDIALSVRHDSTHEGWVRLQSRRNQLAGRTQRLQVRPSGQFDDDGNAIPLRRHHPDTPRRKPTARFVNL